MTLIILDRIVWAVFLDRKVYSEIAEDKDALVQAVIVVFLTGIISVIGILFNPLLGFYKTNDIWYTISGLWFYLILMLILSLAGWFMVTGVMHITAKLLGGKADFVSYLKAIGFARVPGVLAVILFPGVFGVMLYIGWIIGPIWVFACYVTATKVVHRLSPGKAVIAAVIVPIILAVLIIWMSSGIYSWMGLGKTEAGLYIAVILTLLSLFSLI